MAEPQRAPIAILEKLAALSRNCDLVLGAVIEEPDFRYSNASLYFSVGSLTHVHRKVYLPTYGMFDEQRYFAAGDRFREDLLDRRREPVCGWTREAGRGRDCRGLATRRDPRQCESTG